MKMKIVTYNVNGLRPRIAQFGSLLKLLDSFDADIICFQETKLRRQELRADLVIADGYESFLSCTRTSEKGRTGYSGVATFCRVKSAFSSNEVALPIAAEEGFTGLLKSPQNGKGSIMPSIAEGLEEFSKDDLLKVDSEGRCVITDHGHFVLFNIYGPRAESDDSERILFKLNFYNVLQKRWECLLQCGKRIFVVGDLNIAPTFMDRCDAGPDFENNEFRRWLRSLLVGFGGRFFDVFRAKHPDRRDAYTCWPQNTGAEVFNYGSRIDHILCAGSCLHHDGNLPGHDIVACHVLECDILTQYKRWKDGNSFRWKGERTSKLEGSDHAPVYASLMETPDIPQHNTPSLSARYDPMIHGLQQTLVSMLLKKKADEDSVSCKISNSFLRGNIILESCSQGLKGSFDDGNQSGFLPRESCSSTKLEREDSLFKAEDRSGGGHPDEAACNILITHGSQHVKTLLSNETRKRMRSSQMSLKSFFQKKPVINNDIDSPNTDSSVNKADILQSNQHSIEILSSDIQNSTTQQSVDASQDQFDMKASSVDKEKSGIALLEWQRIQQVMQNSIPLCKGHKEPCVARVVKKQGPNNGRRFYVCARAEERIYRRILKDSVFEHPFGSRERSIPTCMTAVIATVFVFSLFIFFFNCLRRRLNPSPSIKPPTSTCDSDELGAMPVFIYGDSSSFTPSLETENCAICLAEYKHGDEVRALSNCKHVFHKYCIDQWIPLRSLFCPVCRDRTTEGQKQPTRRHCTASERGLILALGSGGNMPMPSQL